MWRSYYAGTRISAAIGLKISISKVTRSGVKTGVTTRGRAPLFRHRDFTRTGDTTRDPPRPAKRRRSRFLWKGRSISRQGVKHLGHIRLNKVKGRRGRRDITWPCRKGRHGNGVSKHAYILVSMTRLEQILIGPVCLIIWRVETVAFNHLLVENTYIAR